MSVAGALSGKTGSGSIINRKRFEDRDSGLAVVLSMYRVILRFFFVRGIYLNYGAVTVGVPRGCAARWECSEDRQSWRYHYNITCYIDM